MLPVVLKEQAAKGSRSERIVGERNLKQREPYDARRTRLREYPIRQPEPTKGTDLFSAFFCA